MMEIKDWNSPTQPTSISDIRRVQEMVRDYKATVWHQLEEHERALNVKTPFFQGSLLQRVIGDK